MKCFTKIAAAFMATALAVTPVVGSLNINTANAIIMDVTDGTLMKVRCVLT